MEKNYANKSIPIEEIERGNLTETEANTKLRDRAVGDPPKGPPFSSQIYYVSR